jgi:hypothetical protein
MRYGVIKGDPVLKSYSSDSLRLVLYCNEDGRTYDSVPMEDVQYSTCFLNNYCSMIRREILLYLLRITTTRMPLLSMSKGVWHEFDHNCGFPKRK